jgi:predicted transcriptional regulator
MTPTPQRNIEDVLCSKTRLKILKALIDSKQTPSEIAKTVGVNFVKANECLHILETDGIPTHAKFGKRIRYYKYNETPKARAVQNLIEIFNDAPFIKQEGETSG